MRKTTLAISFGFLAAGLVAAGLLRGPLAPAASPGLPASVPLLKDDGVVTAQNLISLTYYRFSGKNHTEGLLLKPSGAVRWDVMNYYASARYECADSKISAAALAEILRVATAVHFPTLRPQGFGPMASDGGQDTVGVVYRDRAGHRRKYHAWSAGDSPKAVNDLSYALHWVPRGTLRPCQGPQ